jgi:histidinol-phosphatase (PHP family)
MDPGELGAYAAQLDDLAAAWRGRLAIGIGLEMDWIPGLEDCIEAIAAVRDWDLRLGSVHFLPGPGGLRFIIRCDPAEEPGVIDAYWRLWGEAAASGLFTAMSHADVYRSVDRPPLPGEREAACRALDRAARAGVGVECNTSLLRKGCGSFYPAPWLLEEVLARGLPLTSGSDAHHPEQVGSGFARLEELRRDPRARFCDAVGGRLLPLG